MSKWDSRGQRPTDDEVAWLTLLLRHVPVRDFAWRRTTTDDWQLEFWSDVVRRAEPGLVAPPASLLAFTAWPPSVSPAPGPGCHGVLWACSARILGNMTSKERLRALVEDLPEEQAAELLRLASELFAVPGQRHPLPAFVGIGESSRSDVSERVDEELADGFGR